MTDREIIIELAAKVMGWKIVKRMSREHWDLMSAGSEFAVFDKETGPIFHSGETFDPLTSIEDAWQIVEKLADRGEVFIVKADGLRSGGHNPRFTVLCGNHERTDSNSAPRAICLAALKAVAA